MTGVNYVCFDWWIVEQLGMLEIKCYETALWVHTPVWFLKRSNFSYAFGTLETWLILLFHRLSRVLRTGITVRGFCFQVCRHPHTPPRPPQAKQQQQQQNNNNNPKQTKNTFAHKSPVSLSISAFIVCHHTDPISDNVSPEHADFSLHVVVLFVRVPLVCVIPLIFSILFSDGNLIFT